MSTGTPRSIARTNALRRPPPLSASALPNLLRMRRSSSSSSARSSRAPASARPCGSSRQPGRTDPQILRDAEPQGRNEVDERHRTTGLAGGILLNDTAYAQSFGAQPGHHRCHKLVDQEAQFVIDGRQGHVDSHHASRTVRHSGRPDYRGLSDARPIAGFPELIDGRPPTGPVWNSAAFRSKL